MAFVLLFIIAVAGAAVSQSNVPGADKLQTSTLATATATAQSNSNGTAALTSDETSNTHEATPSSPGPVLIWTQNLTQCFSEDNGLFALNTSTGVDLTYARTNSTMSGQCQIELEIPVGNIVRLDLVSVEAECHGLFFDVSDQARGSTLTSGHLGCKSSPSGTLYSAGNRLSIGVAIYDFPPVTSFHITFTAVPKSCQPQLELRYLSPISGLVQTPGWDGVTNFPPLMDSWIRLAVPAGHVIMISFRHVDIASERPWCQYDRVTLYVGGNTSKNIVARVCEQTSPPPVLYDTGVVHVRFVSYAFHTDAGAGFQLFFTLHGRSALPQQMPDGKWNCSVPFWPDFQQHLPCDLKPQCANGEDELHCPYTTDTCGPGKITLKGRCYLYVVPKEPLSWNEASVTCLRQGARLVSLNTPEEWDDVGSLLRQEKFFLVYAGLKSSAAFLPSMYQYVLQWSDGSVAYYAEAFLARSQSPSCAVFENSWFTLKQFTLALKECDVGRPGHVLCEFDTQADIVESVRLKALENARLLDRHDGISFVQCPDGHMTFGFLACDARSSCLQYAVDSPVTCLVTGKTSQSTGKMSLSAKTLDGSTSLSVERSYLLRFFECANGIESVPYTMVCDHRTDCSDASDENFCVYPPCSFSAPFDCGNGQCLPMASQCDDVEQCTNGADERKCVPFLQSNLGVPLPPAVVTFDGHGGLMYWTPDNYRNFNLSHDCPDSHFRCPGVVYYCLPVYVRCNGVYDCPGREDEAACDGYTCPGFYRCRGSSVCLHPSDVCDGMFQCPEHDDERLCNFTCPHQCTCDGLSFYCASSFPAFDYPQLRYLDARGSNVSMSALSQNRLLIGLVLSDCGLTFVRGQSDNTDPVDIPALPNLRLLDLSNNRLTTISSKQLNRLGNLKQLILSGNPLSSSVFSDLALHHTVLSIETLDLSMVPMAELNVTALSAFQNLVSLNLSGNLVDRVLSVGFQRLQKLRVLDLRGCPVTVFDRSLFQGVSSLESMHADNYKLCCPSTLASVSVMPDCRVPSDEISSCEALLMSDAYRVFLSVFASLAIVGNLGSLLYRVCVRRVAGKVGFDIFVTHLCAADLLMGVYLAGIGVADRLYLGTYLWKDITWRESAACKVAGFLSLLSIEVSAFIICLITLDRFLVLRFPFRRLHFRNRSAHTACAVAWLLGILIAAVPLLPVTSHWKFYGQTGICVPLPITRKAFPGQGYTFGVLIVLNFVLFLLIAAGQASIYLSVRANSITGAATTSKSKDLTIARRLITIAMSDFCCWFPIGLLGLMASCGFPVPGEVSVAIAIFILPLNSALNPFMYTLNVLLERRRQAKENRMKKLLQSQLNMTSVTVASGGGQKAAYTMDTALGLLQHWIRDGLLSKEQVKGQIEA